MRQDDLRYYDSRNKDIGLRNLVRARRLILELCRVELYSKYKFSVLGIFWSFLGPLLTTTVIFLVFGRLFNSYMPENRGYAVWVLTGVLLQVLMLQGISVTALSLQRNMVIMTRNRISPIVVAVASAAAHVCHFVLGSLVIIPIAVMSDQSLSLRILFFPFFLICAVFFGAGVGLLLCGAFMRFDDTVYLFNAAMMILSYLTPIFYPLDILSEKLQQVVYFNPLTSWVLTYRWIFFKEFQISSYHLIAVMFSTIISFILGLIYIRNRWKDIVML